MFESNQLEVPARAQLLAVVADPIRLQVVQTLAREGTRCVCNLQPDPPIPDNKLSYHLKVLRDAGLVTVSRRGKWMDYSLADDALDRLHAALPSLAGVG
ncbi:ArsR/SmtB family transcription factor [Granulicoccus sp. GXG6511]|uniref:ArsR/SmtB family transcription factor n=1 Tax=Granulicoccus sp. GXG6511 TaxID=3381351 RepID=UPI003D7CDCAA